MENLEIESLEIESSEIESSETEKDLLNVVEVIDEENYEINLELAEKLFKEDICNSEDDTEDDSEDDTEDVSDIRGTQDSQDKKSTGQAQIEMFSRMDLKCFNAHMREKQEKKDIYKTFTKEQWKELNDWIFGKSEHNPMVQEKVNNEKEV